MTALDDVRLRTLLNRSLIIALGAEWCLSLWMAQPWSGLDPYDTLEGFGMLGAILAIQSLPPFLLLVSGKRLMRNALTSWLFAIISMVIMVGGVMVMWEATFVTIDPQSGIALVITPLFQLACVLGLLLVTWIVRRLTVRVSGSAGE